MPTLKVPPGWEAATLSEGIEERACNVGYGISTTALGCSDDDRYISCMECVFYGLHLEQLLAGAPYHLEFVGDENE